MDYKEEVFPLNNFALFSKGWYSPVKDGEDLLTTLKHVLALDGYDFISNYNDVLCILLSEIDRYNKYLDSVNARTLDLFTLWKETSEEKNLWHKDISNEEAIVRVIAKFLRYMDSKYIKLQCPFYSRKLTKKYGLTLRPFFYKKSKQGTTYKEMNRVANKYFNQ